MQTNVVGADAKWSPAVWSDPRGRWNFTLKMLGALTKFFGGPNLFETLGMGRRINNSGEKYQTIHVEYDMEQTEQESQEKPK